MAMRYDITYDVLIIFIVPHISKARKSYIRAFEGESVRLKCLVSRHYTRTYKWFHDALEINAEYKGVKIREYKFLRIKSVEIDDSGFYTCSVANDIGIQEITYHLQVKGKHIILIMQF